MKATLKFFQRLKNHLWLIQMQIKETGDILVPFSHLHGAFHITGWLRLSFLTAEMACKGHFKFLGFSLPFVWDCQRLSPGRDMHRPAGFSPSDQQLWTASLSLAAASTCSVLSSSSSISAALKEKNGMGWTIVFGLLTLHVAHEQWRITFDKPCQMWQAI